MNTKLLLSSLVLGSVLVVNANAVDKLPSKVESKKTTNTTPIASAPEIPKSVFNIPANAREGRNPFFPNSVTEKKPVKASPDVLDASSIVLNGITSPPKRTAMINGQTFEEGESGDIKLSNGARLPIKCLEIRADSALIDVKGSQKRELRLRNGI